MIYQHLAASIHAFTELAQERRDLFNAAEVDAREALLFCFYASQTRF